VQHNNEERLHAALGYLPPVEFYRGDPAVKLAERQRKLAEGRAARRRIDEERLKEAA
jgi:hypothetical protein